MVAFALASVAAAALFGCGVEAGSAPELRHARRTAGVVEDAISPRVTERAELPILHVRQASQGFTGTLLLAPDSVCGYVLGDPNRAWTCDTTDRCAYATEQGGWAACCKGLACSASQKACVNSADIATCGSSCLADTMIRKCTASSLPYCGTLTFFNGIQDYQCLRTNATTFLPVSTTYAGQSEFPSGATEYLMTTVVFEAQTTFTVRSTTSTPVSSTPVSSTAATSSSAAPAPAPGNSTPIGAIVGGVVGGVALIALIVFGIWFMKSRQKKQAAAAAESQGMMQTQNTGAGGPGAPGAPMQSPYPTGAGYAAAGAYGQPQTTQYTGATHESQQMGGYYQDPTKPGFQQNIAPTPDSHRQSYQQGPVPAAWAQHTGGSSGYTGQPSQHTGGSAEQQYAQHSGGAQGHPGQQSPQQPMYYEASGNPVGTNDPNPNHRGQLHELS